MNNPVPSERLNQWLRGNGYTLQLMVMAPKGGAVSPQNFIPDGWSMTVQVVELDPTQYLGNGVSNVPADQSEPSG